MARHCTYPEGKQKDTLAPGHLPLKAGHLVFGTRALMQDTVVELGPLGDGHLQRHSVRRRGVLGAMSQSRDVACVGRDYEAVLAAVDPNVVGAVGKRDVDEPGREEDELRTRRVVQAAIESSRNDGKCGVGGRAQEEREGAPDARHRGRLKGAELPALYRRRAVGGPDSGDVETRRGDGVELGSGMLKDGQQSHCEPGHGTSANHFGAE